MTLLNIFKKIGIYLLAGLVLVILGIGFVLYLLFVPIDYIRYKCSPYAKELRKKYHLFLSSSHEYRLYNAIAKKKLRLSYEETEGLVYFTGDGTVYYMGYSCDDFEAHNGEWFEITGYDQKHGEDAPSQIRPISECLDEIRTRLKAEHKAMPIKILIYGQSPDMPKPCPHILCFDDFIEMEKYFENPKG